MDLFPPERLPLIPEDTLRALLRLPGAPHPRPRDHAPTLQPRSRGLTSYKRPPLRARRLNPLIPIAQKHSATWRRYFRLTYVASRDEDIRS
jgi:hypothetical protein